VKIGFCVEGSTDRAFVTGLRDRWCPRAELVEGLFRGSTGMSQRRELLRSCTALNLKGVDAIIILTDSNGFSWRDIRKSLCEQLPSEYLHLVVVGVPDRNVESWICCDKEYISRVTQIPFESLACSDPKDVFEAFMEITRTDKREREIASIVQKAPIQNWFTNRSFEDFYEDILKFSQRNGCQIRNEREIEI